MTRAPRRPLRLIVLASGAQAIPVLMALMGGGDQVVLVVSAPPAPAGRGRALTPAPAAAFAMAMGLPVLETDAVNSPETIEAIRRAEPDLLCVMAFRGFLGRALLETGLHPPLNVHPSLLPRHRGPAPVNWTLISGDKLCGVSVCLMGPKMDAGPVAASKAEPVPEGVGAGTLETILAAAGAELLVSAIESLKAGALTPEPQDEALATVNRLLVKSDGRLDLGLGAFETARRINGVDPWPGAQTRAEGRLYKLFGALAAEGAGPPGRILGLSDDGRLLIACGQGAVSVESVQPEGRPKMSAADFSRGSRIQAFEPGW
jgi:methionyl-tRNA formyltransferase